MDHDLRHSFAYNHLLKSGYMYSLQQGWGHKEVALSVDLYGNLKAKGSKGVPTFNF